MKVEWLRQVFVKSGANSKFALLRVRCQGDGFSRPDAFSLQSQVRPLPSGSPISQSRTSKRRSLSKTNASCMLDAVETS